MASDANNRLPGTPGEIVWRKTSAEGSNMREAIIKVRNFLRSEEAPTMLEYGLLDKSERSLPRLLHTRPVAGEETTVEYSCFQL